MIRQNVSSDCALVADRRPLSVRIHGKGCVAQTSLQLATAGAMDPACALPMPRDDVDERAQRPSRSPRLTVAPPGNPRSKAAPSVQLSRIPATSALGHEPLPDPPSARSVALTELPQKTKWRSSTLGASRPAPTPAACGSDAWFIDRFSRADFADLPQLPQLLVVASNRPVRLFTRNATSLQLQQAWPHERAQPELVCDVVQMEQGFAFVAAALPWTEAPKARFALPPAEDISAPRHSLLQAVADAARLPASVLRARVTTLLSINLAVPTLECDGLLNTQQWFELLRIAAWLAHAKTTPVCRNDVLQVWRQRQEHL